MNTEPEAVTWTVWYITARDDIGVILGLIGILLSIIGFWIAFVQIRKTKSAAEAALDAAKEARDNIRNFDSVIDFSSVIAMVEEIKRHQRAGNWVILPDRYSQLKSSLIAIKAVNNQLSVEHKTTLQQAITQFTNIEGRVESSLATNMVLDTPRLNKLVSRELDNLREVLIQLKNAVG